MCPCRVGQKKSFCEIHLKHYIFPLYYMWIDHKKNFSSFGTVWSPPNCRLKLKIHFRRPKKNFFKVWVVGTLNLCLKVPKKMQNTRDESDHSKLRKRQKTAKNSKTWVWPIFEILLTFSLSGIISSITNLFRHLETQV